MIYKSLHLSELAEIGDGNHSSNYPKSSEMLKQGIPFLRSGNIQDGKISDDNLKFISPEKHKILKKGHIKTGDILFTNRGEIGKIGIVDERFNNANLNSQVVWIRVGNQLYNKFLYYYLSSPSVKNFFLKSKTGTALQQITIKQLKSLLINFPPFSEQQRIVAKLDREFSEINKYIENTSKTENQLIFLTKNFLREIVKDNKYQWNYKTLSEISINLDNKRIPITKSKRNHGKIPYYGASGIVDYVSDWIFDDDLLLISEDGANLLMRTYPIAFSVYGKCWVNNHAHVLKFKNKMLQNWVENYLNSIDLSDYISGMAQPKLNQTKLNIIKIPIPREDLLEDLISKIKSFKKNSELFQLQIAKKISLIKSLKNSILKQNLDKVA